MILLYLVLTFASPVASASYAIFNCEAALRAPVTSTADVSLIEGLSDFEHFLRRPANWQAPRHQVNPPKWKPATKNVVDPDGSILKRLKVLESDATELGAGHRPVLFQRVLCGDDVERAVTSINAKRFQLRQSYELADKQLGKQFTIPRGLVRGGSKSATILLNLSFVALTFDLSIPTGPYLACGLSAIVCNHVWLRLSHTKINRYQALPHAIEILERMDSDPNDPDLFSFEADHLRLRSDWAAELASGNGLSQVNRRDAFGLNSTVINRFAHEPGEATEALDDYLIDHIVFKPRYSGQPCWITTLRGPQKVAPPTTYLRE